MKLISLIAAAASVLANIAVYWGQNSFGSEQLLALYCELSEVDVILLSFMNGFPNLELNFGGKCNDKYPLGLLHCLEIAKDIKTCQSQGKKILMSLGGAIGTYGFSNDQEAEDFATTLWNKFGGGDDDERPFDDAIIDGIDFDIENQNQVGYPALGKKLREHFDSDSLRSYYLAAAPQCVYPDALVGDLMLEVPLDYAFIQFYNNPCAVDKQFNWDTWADWAKSSPNPNIKLYLGLPGALSLAGLGYIDAQKVCLTIQEIQSCPNFGGVMFWDASLSFGNDNMIPSVGKALAGSGAGSPAPQAPQAKPSPDTSSDVSSPDTAPQSSAPPAFSAVPTSLVTSYRTANADAYATAVASPVAVASFGQQAQKQVDLGDESYESTSTSTVQATVYQIVPTAGADADNVGGVAKQVDAADAAPQPTTLASYKHQHHRHRKTAYETVYVTTTVIA